MSNYLSKRFFSLALLIPILSCPFIAYADQRERTLEQQRQEVQEIDTRWVQLQPEVITNIQEASISAHPALQELLTYAADMVAPYDIALAAIDAALEYHTKNNQVSCAELMRNYKQALMTGTVIIPQDQIDNYITRGTLRERCFPAIRTQSLRANRVCALELGVNNATANNLTVAGNQTITGNLTVNGTINNNNNGPIDPLDLCTDGALNLPCNLNVGGNQTISGNLTVNGTITGALDPASLCSGDTLTLPCHLSVTGNHTVSGDHTVGGNLIVNGTITGALDPASLCSDGVATFPCNLQFNSTNNTLNALGNSVEPVLNLIRGTIAPQLTAAVSISPLGVVITNNPVALAGSGFTVAATPPINILNIISAGALIGTINVTFGPEVQFTSRPSITLGAEDDPNALLQTQLFDYHVTNVSTTGFSLEIISLLGIPLLPGLSLLAGNINFTAVGPTTGS